MPVSARGSFHIGNPLAAENVDTSRKNQMADRISIAYFGAEAHEMPVRNFN
jgi:hypothetical protein